MPDPSTSLATLRPELGGSLMEFDLEADRQGFIAGRVLPTTEVGAASGTYGVVPLEQLLQNKSTRRAMGSAYPRGSWEYDDASYATEEHGWEEPVDNRESNIYRDYFDAELVAASRARDFVLRAREIRAAELVQNASTWSATSVGTEWSTISATPIANIRAASQLMFEETGRYANALIINREVFINLRKVTEIITRIASAGAGDATKASDITAGMLAQVFDLDDVIVADGAQNTANEGQTGDVSAIWSSEYASVVRLVRTNDIREPGLGRTFHYGADGSQMGALIEEYRDEVVRAQIIRARMDVDEVIVYTEMQQLLDNITA